ncbi:MAG: enolase C-terminal domain-like protein [Sandaracinaceae bacterium]
MAALIRARLTRVRGSVDAANASRTWSDRESLRLRLSLDGATGDGEAAPLPGVSPETLDEVERGLRALDWTDAPIDGAPAIEAWCARIRPVSARFAAESALCSLAAAAQGRPMWSLLGDAAPSHPLAITAFDGTDGLLRAARATPGAVAYKAKVGAMTAADELAVLRDVRAAIGDAELRLDANRSLSASEARARMEGWASVGAAFVEEPCPLAELDALGEGPVPIALDESIAEDEDAALGRADVAVYVLKPSRLGLFGALRLARRAAPRAVVVSHLLEGEIARAACAHLALVLGGPAAGLGAHPGLAALSQDVEAPFLSSTAIARPEAPGLGVVFR